MPPCLGTLVLGRAEPCRAVPAAQPPRAPLQHGQQLASAGGEQAERFPMPGRVTSGSSGSSAFPALPPGARAEPCRHVAARGATMLDAGARASPRSCGVEKKEDGVENSLKERVARGEEGCRAAEAVLPLPSAVIGSQLLLPNLSSRRTAACVSGDKSSQPTRGSPSPACLIAAERGKILPALNPSVAPHYLLPSSPCARRSPPPAAWSSRARGKRASSALKINHVGTLAGDEAAA